jgi:hypothetical protein
MRTKCKSRNNWQEQKSKITGTYYESLEITFFNTFFDEPKLLVSIARNITYKEINKKKLINYHNTLLKKHDQRIIDTNDKYYPGQFIHKTNLHFKELKPICAKIKAVLEDYENVTTALGY